MKTWTITFAAMFGIAACIAYGDAQGVPAGAAKVVTISEHGEINAPEAVANVARQTSNEVAVVIAAEAAAAAERTAHATTNAIQQVADAMVNGDTVVYSYGDVSSFAVAVFFQDGDEVRIFTDEVNGNVVKFEQDGDTVVATIPFLVTRNIGLYKPIVLSSSAVSDLREHELPDADVTTPVSIAAPQGESGFAYKLTATVRNVTEGRRFFRLLLDPDVPAGDGSTLDLVNGVSGGLTTTVPASGGWPALTFRGGVLVEVGSE